MGRRGRGPSKRERVVDTDYGYRAILRNLRQLAGIHPAVYVGIRANAGNHPDGPPFVQIAAANEFGTRDGHVPERSYLRSTIDKRREGYAKILRTILDRSIMGGAGGAPGEAKVKGDGAGNRAIRRGLDRLGLKAVGDVQQTMTDLDDPPNAPSTIARKRGADNPLIDTGRLRQSIDHEVRDE